MTDTMSAEAAKAVSASGKSRPYCQSRSACEARTPGKHCVRCAVHDPEIRARRMAGVVRVNADPEVRARKRAAALRLTRNPEIVAKRVAGNALARRDPSVRERHREACRATKMRMMQDPVFAEKMREAGRKRAALLGWEMMNNPVARAKAIRGIRATQLPWCPEEYWDFNAQLRRKGRRLPERKAIIFALIAEREEADRRAEREAAEAEARFASSFEGRLARVASGKAGLAVRQTVPGRAYDFTFGGVASASL